MLSTEPTKVGLLTDPYLQEWQVRAIEQLQAETGVDVSIVVSNTGKENTETEAEAWNSRGRVSLVDVTLFLEFLRRRDAWALVLAERKLGWFLGDDEPLCHQHAVADVDCLADAEHIQCEPQTEGLWEELPEDVVTRIEETCDVVVRFGFGLIRGGILTAPSYGVLSFHPADIRKYRGLGPERIFFDGRDTAGSTLQRLNEKIDGGEIVAFDEVDISTCHTLWDVEERVSAMQIRLLTEGVKNVQNPAFEPTVVPEDELGEFYYISERHKLTFAGWITVKNLFGRLQRTLHRVSGTPGRIAPGLVDRLP